MLDILIVEDNKEIGNLLCDFLRKENYTVSVAQTGEKALELYEKYGARVIVLDIMLPGLDGFAVCSKIRETSNTHRLKELLASCGVALVLLPNLKNCGVNGAVKWLGKDKVVLDLNDRRKYADTFWFALFHELGHVLQQRVKVLLVSEKNKAGLETDTLIQKLETEADLFSQDTLIPKDEYLEFIEDNPRGFTSDSVRAFAKKINILPGIVVGRLQQDQYLTYQTNLNSLKIKYVIS